MQIIFLFLDFWKKLLHFQSEQTSRKKVTQVPHSFFPNYPQSCAEIGRNPTPAYLTLCVPEGSSSAITHSLSPTPSRPPQGLKCLSVSALSLFPPNPVDQYTLWVILLCWITICALQYSPLLQMTQGTHGRVTLFLFPTQQNRLCLICCFAHRTKPHNSAVSKGFITSFMSKEQLRVCFSLTWALFLCNRGIMCVQQLCTTFLNCQEALQNLHVLPANGDILRIPVD